MFTGIIKEMGTVKRRKKLQSGGVILTIHAKKVRLKKSESVAVNGVCLTVTKIFRRGFSTEVIPETLTRTNLGKLRSGEAVNLEPSMKLSDRVSGHFVLGHVDATGKVLQKKSKANETILTVQGPKKLMRSIVPQGSIAINGVSLTVTKTRGKTFSVAIIPFTLRNTNLGMLHLGDLVTIEVDLIARYLSTL